MGQGDRAMHEPLRPHSLSTLLLFAVKRAL